MTRANPTADRKIPAEIVKNQSGILSSKKQRGRPSKYGIVDPAQVAKIVGELGGTDKELAAALGVSHQGLKDWKKQHADLLATLKKSKELADSQVEKSLFQRAIGYSHPDVHISTHEGRVIVTPTVKHYPPDTTACIYWTKNRRPDLWRDAQRHEHTGADGGAIKVEDVSAEDSMDYLKSIGAIDASGKLIKAGRN